MKNKKGTKRPFWENCGLLCAIKQPKMVQLIRSKIQKYNLYLENVSKDLKFWFQHFKGVHFGKIGTKGPFLENCGLLSAIRQPKMVQLIRSKIYKNNLYLEKLFKDLEFWFQHLKGVHFGKKWHKKAIFGKLWLAKCNKTTINGPINAV